MSSHRKSGKLFFLLLYWYYYCTQLRINVIITHLFSVAAAAAAVLLEVSPTVLDLGVVVVAGAVIESLSGGSPVRHRHAID